MQSLCLITLLLRFFRVRLSFYLFIYFILIFFFKFIFLLEGEGEKSFDPFINVLLLVGFEPQDLVQFSRFKISLVISTTKRELYKFREKRMQTN